MPIEQKLSMEDQNTLDSKAQELGVQIPYVLLVNISTSIEKIIKAIEAAIALRSKWESSTEGRELAGFTINSTNEDVFPVYKAQLIDDQMIPIPGRYVCYKEKENDNGNITLLRVEETRFFEFTQD